MGGFISLYALYARPETFGFAGVFSPHFPFSAQLYDFVARAPELRTPLYLDIGTAEWGDPALDAAYVAAFERMLRVLESKNANMRAVLEPGGVHHETAWARRFPDAMRWLLGQVASGRSRS